jgi:hypothetical protein
MAVRTADKASKMVLQNADLNSHEQASHVALHTAEKQPWAMNTVVFLAKT